MGVLPSLNDRECPVPACGPAEWSPVRPLTSHPHGNARLLHRLRKKGHVVDPVLFALIRERLAAPEPRQERRVPRPASGRESCCPSPRRTRRTRCRADCRVPPEDQPAVGEMVERNGRARHLPRSPPRQRRHHRPDADSLRSHGDGRQRHPRVCERLLHSQPDVVPREHPVPSGLLRLIREFRHESRVRELLEWGKIDSVLQLRLLRSPQMPICSLVDFAKYLFSAEHRHSSLGGYSEGGEGGSHQDCSPIALYVQWTHRRVWRRVGFWIYT